MYHYRYSKLSGVMVFTGLLVGCPGITSVSGVKSDVTETNRVVSTLLPPEVAVGFLGQQSDDGCAFTEQQVRSRQGTAKNYTELRAAENYVRSSDEYLLWLFYEPAGQPPVLLCSWARLDNKHSEKLLTALASLGARSGCAGATTSLGELLPPEIALSFLSTSAKTSDCSFSDGGAQVKQELVSYANLRFKEQAETSQVELYVRQGDRRDRLCRWENLDEAARRKLLTALASLGVGPLCN
jgi:hemolysin-activating ACP:hemolysin acyltransferase